MCLAELLIRSGLAGKRSDLLSGNPSPRGRSSDRGESSSTVDCRFATIFSGAAGNIVRRGGEELIIGFGERKEDGEGRGRVSNSTSILKTAR